MCDLAGACPPQRGGVAFRQGGGTQPSHAQQKSLGFRLIVAVKVSARKAC